MCSSVGEVNDAEISADSDDLPSGPPILTKSSPLFDAIKDRNSNEAIEIIETEKGLRLNWQNENGDTALHLAARNGLADVVRCLLQNGANKNITNKNGETAEIIADETKCIEIFNILTQPQAGS